MTPWTKLVSTAAAVLAVTALAAGCGSSGAAPPSAGSSSTSYSRTPPSLAQHTRVAAASVATIEVDDSSLGPVLANGDGRTAYLFDKDTGTASTCYGACARIWRPVTTTRAPRSGNGTDPAKLGTSKRRDGTLQVTYDGHPLYTYAGDTGPDETNGQGVDEFGARWYAITPAGNAVQSGGW